LIVDVGIQRLTRKASGHTSPFHAPTYTTPSDDGVADTNAIPLPVEKGH
jgi:hypothetical protein